MRLDEEAPYMAPSAGAPMPFPMSIGGPMGGPMPGGPMGGPIPGGAIPGGLFSVLISCRRPLFESNRSHVQSVFRKSPENFARKYETRDTSHKKTGKTRAIKCT